MLARQSLHEGKLEEALAQLHGEVRKEPGNSQHRLFLFKLLAILGRWERSLIQLETAGQLDPAAMPLVQTYRRAIDCEAKRAAVFAGKETPTVFGEPEEWMALLLTALGLSQSGKHSPARELRDKALEAAAAIPGEIDGEPFLWLADADSRFGPMLEVVVDGRYSWMPFSRLSAIRMEPPADLSDLVWMPALLTLANGGQLPALLPTRYPGTEASGDVRLLMSRRTEWNQHEAETYSGLGQRMLATDRGEYALMDIRQIIFEPASAPAAA